MRPANLRSVVHVLGLLRFLVHNNWQEKIRAADCGDLMKPIRMLISIQPHTSSAQVKAQYAALTRVSSAV